MRDEDLKWSHVREESHLIRNSVYTVNMQAEAGQ